MPQKKVTLRTRKPRDGEIRHYVNTRLGDLAEATEIRTRTIVAEEIAVAVLGLEAHTERAISNCTDAFKTAIATANLGNVRLALNPNCTSAFSTDCKAKGIKEQSWCVSCLDFYNSKLKNYVSTCTNQSGGESCPERFPDESRNMWCEACCAAFPRPVPYVLISIGSGVTEVGRMVGKVDVDIFDWEFVTAAINENEDYILSDRQIQYLKEENADLYNKYMAQKYEASMGPAIVRAKLVENWLEEPNSAVLKALQQRGWLIKPYDKE